MAIHMTTENPDDLLTPEEAAAYLAKRWGRKSFSTEGLRSLRRRKNLTPAKETSRLTLWRRGYLDTIEEPKVQSHQVEYIDPKNVDKN